MCETIFIKRNMYLLDYLIGEKLLNLQFTFRILWKRSVTGLETLKPVLYEYKTEQKHNFMFERIFNKRTILINKLLRLFNQCKTFKISKQTNSLLQLSTEFRKQ